MDIKKRITFTDSCATVDQSFIFGRTYEVDFGLADSLLKAGHAKLEVKPEPVAPPVEPTDISNKKVDKKKNEVDNNKPAN